MAELVITAAQLLPTANAPASKIVSGEAIAIGDVIARDDNGKGVKADANGAAPLNAPIGIAVCSSAAAGQSILYVSSDSNFKIGATVVNGTPYYLTATPGKIGEFSDLAAGMSVCQVGYGKGTDHMVLHFFNTGQTL